MKSATATTNTVNLYNLSKLTFGTPEYNALRDTIFNENLGLVGAAVRRHGFKNHTEHSDLISEGQNALRKAIEGFIPAKGYRFSTYAMRAINNDLLRYKMDRTRDHKRTPFSFDPTREGNSLISDERAAETREIAGEVRRVFEENSAELTEIQRAVIGRRFGFEGDAMTLEQIGETLNLTKERVRQIQNQALVKIKAVVEMSVL